MLNYQIFIVLITTTFISFLTNYMEPRHRDFRVTDISIQRKYKNREIINNNELVIISFIIPVVIIIVVEKILFCYNSNNCRGVNNKEDIVDIKGCYNSNSCRGVNNKEEIVDIKGCYNTNNNPTPSSKDINTNNTNTAPNPSLTPETCINNSSNNYIIFLLLIYFITSYALNNALINTLKIIIGELRPDFIDRCIPILGKCTGKPFIVREGRKSFPSGHTSSMFCSIVYLLLVIYKKYVNIIKGLKSDENKTSKEGVNDNCSSYKGVSDKDSNYKGVNDKDSNYKGVNDKDSNYKGVSDKESSYRGVNDKDSNYKGVSDKDSSYRGINNSKYKEEGVNDNDNKNITTNFNNPNITSNPSLTLDKRINRITVNRGVLYFNPMIISFLPLILLIIIGISISSAVGISRIYDNRHHVHDVVCGGFIGISSAIIMFYLLSKELKLKGIKI